MEPECQGCRERDARIARLEQQVAELMARVRDLEARLGQNASNSSLPPSANPPQAPPPVRKKPTGRKPGGQPGHAAHLRVRLPAARLTEPIVHYLPELCEVCQDDLPQAPDADDPEPRWHQVVELPEFPVQVTEHQAHARTCPSCEHVTWAKIPHAVADQVCGPRLTATLSYLSGVLHASKRGIEAFVETVLGVPIALGTVSNLEQEMSAALASMQLSSTETLPARVDTSREVVKLPSLLFVMLAIASLSGCASRSEQSNKVEFEHVIDQVAFSPDGQTLAVADSTMIVLLDPTNLKTRANLKGHTKRIKALAFSPTGKMLASAGFDGDMRIWDMEAHKELALLRGSGSWIVALAFSPDGKTLAGAGGGPERRCGRSRWEPDAFGRRHATALERRGNRRDRRGRSTFHRRCWRNGFVHHSRADGWPATRHPARTVDRSHPEGTPRRPLRGAPARRLVRSVGRRL